VDLTGAKHETTYMTFLCVVDRSLQI